MATCSEVTEEVETINCPNCLSKFIAPRLLPCLHTICEKCLNDQIESRVQSSTQFLCPICKTPTVPFNTTITEDKWASQFVLDCTINSLIDSTVNFDKNDKQCDPCRRDDEDATAALWCVECKEKLCSPCGKHHKRNKYTVLHKIVPIDDVGEEHINTPCSFKRECARHCGKPLELFCLDHRELCCVLCFASSHRECNIQGIDDIANQQAKRFDCYKVVDELMKVKSEMEKVANGKNSNKTQLAQEKDQIMNAVDSIADKLIGKINQLRQSFREKADHLHEEAINTLFKNFKQIRGFIANISNSCIVLAKVAKNGSPSDKFVIFETIRSQIISHQQHLHKILKDDTEVRLNQKQNQALQDIMESLDSLCTVEVTLSENKVMNDSLKNIDDNIRKLNSDSQPSTPMNAAQVGKRDTMTTTVTLVKRVTLKDLGQEDKKWIYSGTFLSDGRLIMSDCENKRLLQLGDDYELVREYQLEGYPYSVVTENNQNEIYIAINTNNQHFIHRCTLDSQLSIIQKITAPEGIRGIALYCDSILVGTPDAVIILSQDGSTTNTIPKKGGDCFIAVSHSQRTICHRDGDSIVSRTVEGEEMFRYQNPDLKDVSGICFDSRNNLLVCGCDSGNIHQVSADGKRNKILLTELNSITQPWFLLFNTKKNELIVTSYKENTALEVYKLQ